MNLAGNKLGAKLLKEKEVAKQEKLQSGGKKAPRFYVFKLESRTTANYGRQWRF